MVHRRTVLATALSGVIGTTKDSLALEQCPAPGFPVGTCSAMLDPQRFSQLAVPSLQMQSQWCWAACIQMICRWHGLPLSQASIVNRVFGGLVNMPGDDYVLTNALNSAWVADDGRNFTIRASVFSPALGVSNVSNQQVVDDLKNDRPLINGSRTHATVVARVDYFPSSTGQPQISQVHVIDPFPGAAAPPLFARFSGRGRDDPNTIRWVTALLSKH